MIFATDSVSRKAFFTIFFTVILVLSAPLPFVLASSKSPYDSGYDHGCDDAGIFDPSDRYINQPEKGPAYHTEDFMNGYNTGFNSCFSDSSLPDCDGSYQDCVTERGDVCEAGSTDHECELDE